MGIYRVKGDLGFLGWGFGVGSELPSGIGLALPDILTLNEADTLKPRTFK